MLYLSHYGLCETYWGLENRFKQRSISGHDATYVLFDSEKKKFYVDELGKTWGIKRFHDGHVVQRKDLWKSHPHPSPSGTYERKTFRNFNVHLSDHYGYDNQLHVETLINGQYREGVKSLWMGHSPRLKHIVKHNKHVYGCSHHVSHAYSSLIQSPFKGKIAFLSFDGGSHDNRFMYGHFDENANIHFKRVDFHPGLVYVLFAAASKWQFLSEDIRGDDNDLAGKIMGLSAYGDYDKNFHEGMLQTFNTKVSPEGSITQDASPYDDKLLVASVSELQRDANKWIHDLRDGSPQLDDWRKLSEDLREEQLELLERAKKLGETKEIKERLEEIKEIGNREMIQCAKHTQSAFEEHVIGFLKTEEMQRILEDCNNQLIVTGGCALNVLTNQRVRDELGIDVWVAPHCDDSGHGIGIMAHYLYTNKIIEPTFRYDFTFSGRKLNESEEEIQHHLRKRFIKIDIPTLVNYLTEGKLVGYIEGNSEVGPRALGHRSILCDPSFPNAKGVLNEKVKHREYFRPFAPICREEDVSTYFEKHNYGDMSYMSFALKTKKKYRKELSAITHVDNTARVQTVSKDNPETKMMHDILSALPKNKVLLNTSFNVNLKEGKLGTEDSLTIDSVPILNSLHTAFKSLLYTELDFVVYNDNGDLWITNKEMAWGKEDITKANKMVQDLKRRQKIVRVIK